MALPVDYNTVTVKGKYVYLDGNPAEGSVKFTGKAVAISNATATVVLPTTIQVNLVDGQFQVELPATDDPDVLPNGWTYKVEETFTRGSGRTFEMELPLAAQASGGVDLSIVAPLPPSAGDPTAFVTLAAFEQHVASGDGGSGGGSVDWSAILNKPTAFPPVTHTHLQSEVSGLSTALANKANTTHTHAQADVTGLVTALAGKASVGKLWDGTQYVDSANVRVWVGPVDPATLGSVPDGTIWFPTGGA